MKVLRLLLLVLFLCSGAALIYLPLEGMELAIGRWEISAYEGDFVAAYGPTSGYYFGGYRENHCAGPRHITFWGAPRVWYDPGDYGGISASFGCLWTAWVVGATLTWFTLRQFRHRALAKHGFPV